MVIISTSLLAIEASAARLSSNEFPKTTACVMAGGLIPKDAQPGAGVVVVVDDVVVDDDVVDDELVASKTIFAVLE
jgi:hypothetical protein